MLRMLGFLVETNDVFDPLKQDQIHRLFQLEIISYIHKKFIEGISHLFFIRYNFSAIS